MQPAIEDDALLFSLDDVLAGQVANETATQDMPIGTTRDKSAELEQELEHLRAQFSEYRLAVEKTLDERWTDSSNDAKTGGAEPVKDENHQDPGYFDSYSYNGESRPRQIQFHELLTNLVQTFIRSCCKTRSEQTPTETLSTVTSICSPARLF